VGRPRFQSTVDYIASQPPATQKALRRVRAAIMRALPRAEEIISYNMPAYKVTGGTALFFAGWKKHYSLYPASERLAAAFAKDLAPYEIVKGTIRFPLGEPVPQS